MTTVAIQLNSCVRILNDISVNSPKKKKEQEEKVHEEESAVPKNFDPKHKTCERKKIKG